MKLRDPLTKAKGLGASGDGSRHWWEQRISALLLIPLTLWFLFSILQLIGSERYLVINWVAQPFVAVLLILYFGFMFFHGQLGLQVVIEDYVHKEGLRFALIMLCKLLMLLGALISIFAVLKIAL